MQPGGAQHVRIYAFVDCILDGLRVSQFETVGVHESSEVCPKLCGNLLEPNVT
jgi:hypothetical protein